MRCCSAHRMESMRCELEAGHAAWHMARVPERRAGLQDDGRSARDVAWPSLGGRMMAFPEDEGEPMAFGPFEKALLDRLDDIGRKLDRLLEQAQKR